MRMVKPSGLKSRSGSVSSAGDSGRRAAGRTAGEAAGVTVRNDGQSPSRQEKSRLQEDWWIRVLRPNSVATGWTDRQLDVAAAVAAALADPLVDERPLGRRRRLAAAALAALLRRALLVVDQHGDAVDRGQFPLHVDQVVAVPDVGARGQAGAAAGPGRRW